MSIEKHTQSSDRSGLATGDYLLALRMIVGWTYFSAFWRRLVLADKLDPNGPGYVGEKFNHFLPNALGIQPVIEFFVSHPELLWWKLVIFTIVEGLVGFAVILGFMTRWMGLAVTLLAFGILLAAGWIGTTCLDEWQIGILGIGGGLALWGAGGGRWSLDGYLQRKGLRVPIVHRFDGVLDFAQRRGVVLLLAIGAFALSLFTNQVFHGGVWGTLHNKSVRPVVELSEARLDADALMLDLYRVEGADVYGSFAIGLSVLSEEGLALVSWGQAALSSMDPAAIENRYVAKIKPGAHSLILPLGARATVRFRDAALMDLPAGRYRVRLLDISGASWETALEVDG